jgi:hypothetical protein
MPSVVRLSVVELNVVALKFGTDSRPSTSVNDPWQLEPVTIRSLVINQH